MRAALLALSIALVSCAGSDGPPSLAVTGASPSPLSARGGEEVTLRGQGFAAGDVVLLEKEKGRDVEVVSSTELRLVTPPLFAGLTRITVKSRDGDEAWLSVDVAPLDLRFLEAPPDALAAVPGDTTRAAVAGDFDGDGDVDLITATAGPCRFFENDGRGNFTGPKVDPMGPEDPHFPDELIDVRALAAADLDGDGDLDLVLGSGGGAPSVVYENDGHGLFSLVALALPEDADDTTALALGDLDGDGLVELVITNATPDDAPARLYRNTSKKGVIRFEAAAAGDLPARDWVVSAAALADLDGDGDLDLLLATPGAADGITLRMLVRDGSAFHDAPGGALLGGASVTALAVADLDGDGAPEIVAGGPGQDRLLLNDGAGHFFDATATAMPLDASPAASITLVDLDRDRRLDLLIGNQGAQSRVYLNDGQGRFVDHTPLLPIRSDDTVWIGAVDVDDDADQDLILFNASASPPRLYLSVVPSTHEAP